MVRRSLAKAGLLVLSLFTAGCDLINPCDLTDEALEANTLDKNWKIKTVNGAPIPAAGLAIPGSSDRIKFGALIFTTTSTEGGCKESASKEHVLHKGSVVVAYDLATSSGVDRTQSYAGSFVYDLSTGEVTLRADEQSTIGSRVVNEMSFAGSIPLLGGQLVTFEKLN